MKVEYVDGKFQFSLQCALEDMTADERVALIEALSCEEAILKHVLDQVIDGHTESWFHGYKSSGDITPYTAIGAARRRIAEASSQIAADEIEALKRSIASAKELGNEGWRRYHEECARQRGLS